MKKTLRGFKRATLMQFASLLSIVAVTTVDTASAWYVYSGDVPEELLK